MAPPPSTEEQGNVLGATVPAGHPSQTGGGRFETQSVGPRGAQGRITGVSDPILGDLGSRGNDRSTGNTNAWWREKRDAWEMRKSHTDGPSDVDDRKVEEISGTIVE